MNRRLLLVGFKKCSEIGFCRSKLFGGSKIVAFPFGFTNQATRTLTTGTYYDILGVAKDAKPSEIKDAYIEKTKQHHPDIKTSNANADDFLQISEAYKVLSSSSSRRQYDFQQFGKSSDFNRFESGEYNLPEKDSLRGRPLNEERTIKPRNHRKTEPIIDQSVKIALSGNARLILDYLIGGLATICIAMYLISRYQKQRSKDLDDKNE